MDEPCSALDPTSTRRIEETIDELRHAGDDRDRHPQHAAGGPRLPAGRLLPGRAGRSRGDRRAGSDRPRSSSDPSDPGPPTTSTGGSDDRPPGRRHRRPPDRRAGAVAAQSPRLRPDSSRPTGSSTAVAHGRRHVRAGHDRCDRRLPRLPVDPDPAPLRTALLHRDPVAARARTGSASPRCWWARSRWPWWPWSWASRWP